MSVDNLSTDFENHHLSKPGGDSKSGGLADGGRSSATVPGPVSGLGKHRLSTRKLGGVRRRNHNKLLLPAFVIYRARHRLWARTLPVALFAGVRRPALSNANSSPSSPGPAGAATCSEAGLWAPGWLCGARRAARARRQCPPPARPHLARAGTASGRAGPRPGRITSLGRGGCAGRTRPCASGPTPATHTDAHGHTRARARTRICSAERRMMALSTSLFRCPADN